MYSIDYHHRGLRLVAAGRFEEAVKAFDTSLKMPPSQDQWSVKDRLLAVAKLHRGSDELNADIADFTDAIRRNPADAVALFSRGLSLAAIGGRHEDAIVDYTEALRLQPSYTGPLFKRAESFAVLGRHDDAISDYTAFIGFARNDAVAYSNRGQSLAALGRHEEAVADFGQAIRLDPDDPICRDRCGCSLAALGRHEDAVAEFSQAIRLKPDFAWAFVSRGNALARLGRQIEAIEDYTEAIRLDPGEAVILENRAHTLAEIGRHEDAVVDYTTAIGLEAVRDARFIALPSDDLYQYTDFHERGVSLAALGRFEDAIADFSEAIRRLDALNVYQSLAFAAEPDTATAAKFRRSLEACLSQARNAAWRSPPGSRVDRPNSEIPTSMEYSGFLLRLSALSDIPGATFADLYVSPLPSVPPRKPGEYDDGQDFPDATLAGFTAEPGKAKAIAKVLGLHSWTPADEEKFAWHVASSEAVAAMMVAAERHGVTIEWEQVPSRAKQNAAKLTASDLSINAVASASTKMNWFGVQGHVEVAGDRISLLDLVRASRSGKKFVLFPSGLCGEISDDLAAVLERLATWFNADGAADEAIRIPRLAGLSLLSSDDDALGKVDWGELADDIRQAYDEPVKPFTTHGHLKLSAYQQVGHEWLVRLSRWAPGACLADDMGLGKTRQVLALLMSRNTGPALVVAPASVCHTWLTFDGVKLPVGVLSSHAFDGHQGGKHKPGAGDVVVASYDYAVRHINDLAKTKWSTIVFDEGHALKNRLAARTLQLAKLRAEFRVIVTGTPLENNLAELWSISQFFAPSLFGTAAEFDTRFRRPIEAGDDGRAKVLVELLEPFIQRRLMHEVADGLRLPGLTEVEHKVTLSPAERSHYEARRLLAEKSVREALKTVSEARKRIHTIDLLRQLRSIAVGIDLPMTMTTAGVKVTELCRLVLADKARGEKVLVFSQWTTALELVSQAFEEQGITFDQFDGSLSVRKRTDLQEKFQAGNRDALLLTLGAGGVGINLWTASRVYLLDPWWNPHREKQAICRAYRRGQTLPVVAVRLIAADTVEVQVRELQKRKEALFDKVIRGSAGRTQLTTEELIALLSFKAG